MFGTVPVNIQPSDSVTCTCYTYVYKPCAASAFDRPLSLPTLFCPTLQGSLRNYVARLYQFSLIQIVSLSLFSKCHIQLWKIHKSLSLSHYSTYSLFVVFAEKLNQNADSFINIYRHDSVWLCTYVIRYIICRFHNLSKRKYWNIYIYRSVFIKVSYFRRMNIEQTKGE